MNFNRSLISLFVIMFALATLVLTGCTTSFTMSSINTPGGPIQAHGDVTVVERTTDTTFQSAMSVDMAKHQERLAKIQARVEIARAEAEADAAKAKARAENPCASWFMAPSYCYGYSGGGVGYYSNGSGGSNSYFRTGGGNYTNPSRRPGGSNTSFGGGNPPGGNTGGSGNTGGAH